MKVGSGVSLDGRSIAARGGPAGRTGHHRPAQLPGAHLNGRDNSGDTLAAYGMKVSDRVFLDGGLTAAGTLSFASARFGESVEFKPAALAGEGRVALDMARAQIAGALWWAPTAQVSGRVDLEGAAFGELADDWGAERESANGTGLPPGCSALTASPTTSLVATTSPRETTAGVGTRQYSH